MPDGLDIAERLNVAAAHLPVRQPPTQGEIELRASVIRGKSRRLRRWAVVSAAATTAAIAVTGALVSTTYDGGPDDPVSPAQIDANMVGFGQVSLTAPEGWDVMFANLPSGEKNPCIDGDGFALLPPGPPSESCAERGGVFVYSLDTPQGRDVAVLATELESINGLDSLSFEGCGPLASCAFPFTSRVVVPRERIAVLAMGPSELSSELTRILNSLQPIPDGYTTVPYLFGQTTKSVVDQALQQADLTRGVSSDDKSRLTLAGTEPPAGSVVPRGTSIDLIPWPCPDNSRCEVPSGEPLIVPIDLPTSEWEPGDRGLLALAVGKLRLDADNCVRLSSSYIIWPKNFQAEIRGGNLLLTDPSGVVYREGSMLRMGGGYVPVTPQEAARSDCLPPSGMEVFRVQSEVEQFVGDVN